MKDSTTHPYSVTITNRYKDDKYHNNREKMKLKDARLRVYGKTYWQNNNGSIQGRSDNYAGNERGHIRRMVYQLPSNIYAMFSIYITFCLKC